MSLSKEYTPLVVAKSFTKQYYELLHKKPQQLYRFYKDESNFFHGDEDQTTETISGGENIREKVESLNLAGTTVDLSNGTLDAQKSDNNAIFLVVTGNFIKPGKCARPFVQSFLLVSQSGKATSQPSYYVRNSVFRLFGEEVNAPPKEHLPEPQITTSVFEKKEEVSVPEAVQEDNVDESKTMEVTSEEDDTDKNNIDVVTPPQEEIEVSTVASEPEYVNVSVKPQTDTDTLDSPEETAPKDIKQVDSEPVVVKEKVKPASWACLFTGGTSEPAHEDPKPKKVAISVKKDPVPEKTVSTPKSAPGPPRTLYLCQIPPGTEEADVRGVFESYGTIKKVDVHEQKGFAFVDFAEASSVKKAMQNSGNFMIKNVTIKVEERQTKGAGTASKSGNSNRGGRGNGGNSGNRQGGQKSGDKKQGDGKGGNNNNRNRSGNKSGNAKQANNNGK